MVSLGSGNEVEEDGQEGGGGHSGTAPIGGSFGCLGLCVETEDQGGGEELVAGISMTLVTGVGSFGCLGLGGETEDHLGGGGHVTGILLSL